MKSIIRNCIHESEIFIAEEYDRLGNTIYIYKSSSTKKGIYSLKNEIKGFKWYHEKFKSDLEISIEKETKNYLKLKSKYIFGKKYPPENGFYKNKLYLKNILEHYCNIWGESSSKKGLYNLHGDFTIENIIFQKSIPIIIDWEHFQKSVCPIGFDALNLIFEQLWFEEDNQRTKKNIIKELNLMIKYLRERNVLDPIFFENPLEKMTQFIKNNLKFC